MNTTAKLWGHSWIQLAFRTSNLRVGAAYELPRALITTIPFAEKDKTPLRLLQAAGIGYTINQLARKITEMELSRLIANFDILITGTEPITDQVLARAQKLKLISRVGIGLESVDLLAAQRHGIQVCYTHDAPAPTVAEFTIGRMLAVLRQVPSPNAQMQAGVWQRHFGWRMAACTVGIIGASRIGSRVIQHLQEFGPPCIRVNDIAREPTLASCYPLQWASKEEMFREADVISLHLPLTHNTRNLIRTEQLLLMKPDAILIYTAHGGIIHEQELAAALRAGHLGGAAIDLFERKPYSGELAGIERCVLTAHMGSMSVDCRTRMEIEATQEAVRFVSGQQLLNSVPPEEYEVKRQSE